MTAAYEVPRVTPPRRRTTAHPERAPYQTEAHSIHSRWENHDLTDDQARTAYLTLLQSIRLTGPRWALLGALRSYRHHVHARRFQLRPRPSPPAQPREVSPAQLRREQQQRQPGNSALLNLNVPGQRSTPPASVPRPIGRTHTRIVHDEFSSKNRRERERRARTYAEEYYQALRAWDTLRTDAIEIPRREKGGTGEGRMRPIVGNWASRPMTIEYQNVLLPWRAVPEGTVAPLVNTHPILSTIRDGTTLATLVDPRGGWHPNKVQAVRYAQAVLTLAFHLGDPRAQEHLRNLPVAEIQ